MVMEVGKTKLCRVGQHAGDLGSVVQVGRPFGQSPGRESVL